MIVLGCDIGGTRLKLGVIREGQVVAGSVLATGIGLTFADQLGRVAEELSRLCAQAGVVWSACAGLGISYPSLVNPATATILDHFGKFPDAVGFDLRCWGQQVLGLPVAVENDARMALLGEWRAGAGRNCDNLVMMTLGSGIGSAAVIHGQLLRGVHGQAGCLGGHFTVAYNGQLCACGNVGCGETEAATALLPRQAQALPGFAGSSLRQEPLIDYAAVFRLSAEGDTCARTLLDRSLRVWSATAVNLIHAYDPEKLVIGGGIMASGPVILAAVRSYVERHAHTPWGQVQIVGAELGDHSALVACEYLIREHLR